MQRGKVDDSSTNEEGQSGTQKTPRGKDQDRMGSWQNLIDERIEEAMRQGVFDNLPGKGKPLRMDDNPNEPSDMRMANKLLKDNDLTPAWIADRKALLAEIDALRAEMRRQWDWARIDPTRRATNWNHLVAQWEARMANINRRILDLNLIQPVAIKEILHLRLEHELTRIDAPRQL